MQTQSLRYQSMSHALLYIAGSIDAAPVPSTVRTQSADTEHFCNDAFGIDDARRLFERAHIRAVSGGERAFVVSFLRVTSEAQNALLKLFEEPPQGVVFHLVVPREDMLLPTLRSRLQFAGTAASAGESDAFEQFQQSSFKDRLDMIAVRTKAKDSAWCEDIAAGAEQYLLGAGIDGKAQVAKSVTLLRRYMADRGASLKMLLEELAITLPRT